MTTRIRIALVMTALAAGSLLPAQAEATLILSADGMTVNDTADGITWLADADLPATNQFGVVTCNGTTTTRACINSDGSMDYKAAVEWVKGLNAYNNNAGYLGYNDWQLPATPKTDDGCTKSGPPPAQNGFGYHCTQGALGALYYGGLKIKAAGSALPPAMNNVGPFYNFQPNLYWSGTQQTGVNGPGDNGFHTFSFATGFQGGNVPDDYMDVLPMIQGTPTGSGNLTAIMNGRAVFDPVTGITWSADANLAATFAQDPTLMAAIGMSLCTGISNKNNAPDDICINADGTMDHESAVVFTDALNTMDFHGKTGYLGLQGWTLPPAPDSENCAYGCTDDAADVMTNLFYNELGQQFLSAPLQAGSEVASAAAVADPNDPFSNLQPYQYWSCEAVDVLDPITSACDGVTNVGNPGPFNFQFEFSFANGFLGTAHDDNDAFVTAYFVDPVPEPATFVVFATALAGFGAMRHYRSRAPRTSG